jgi:hypothetical protein
MNDASLPQQLPQNLSGSPLPDSMKNLQVQISHKDLVTRLYKKSASPLPPQKKESRV